MNQRVFVTGILWVILFWRIGPGLSAEEPRSLQLGKPIEREIAGGQVQSYLLQLSKGQYARVVAFQRGIDLVVTVIGTGGSKLVEIDSPNGGWGAEEVSLLAESAETYRLDLAPLYKTATLARYEIRVDELRLSTSQDRDRVLAQKLYAEALELETIGTAEARRRAIARYEKALVLRQATGDRRQAALTLVSIGEIYGWFGERKKELDYYKMAIPLVEEDGDSGEIGGIVYYSTLAHHYLGESQKALELGARALRLFREASNLVGEAYALNIIGLTYASLGDHPKALAYFGDALPLGRRIGDPQIQAEILTHMGQSYSALGEGRRALEPLNESLPLRRMVGDRRYEAITLSALGEAYEKLGERENSLDYFNQALSLQRTTGDRSGEAATLNRIGSIYASFGERQKSLDHYRLALAIRREVVDRAGEAESLYQIARVERDRGDLIEARKDIEAAFGIFDSIRSRVGSRELRASYFSTVRGAYDLYVDLLAQLHGREPGESFDALAFRASENARAKGLLELLTESRADIHQGIAVSLLERERAAREVLNGKLEAQIRLLSGKHTDEAAARGGKGDRGAEGGL